MSNQILLGKRVLVTYADAFMGPVLCEVFGNHGATVIPGAEPLLKVDAPVAIVAAAAHVDIFVANLAIPAPTTAATEVSEEEWNDTFAALVHPLSRLFRAVLPAMIERRSGFAVMKKITARTADQVTWAAAHAIAEHRDKIRTLTFDNGTEFHSYKVLEGVFPVKCYFATPYHSWEHGSNENLDGLLRQYLSKGTCMKRLTQKRCNWIAQELNTRPRKRHGY